jgi:hypothetical protein
MTTPRKTQHNTHLGTPEPALVMATWCHSTTTRATGPKYQSRVFDFSLTLFGDGPTRGGD